MFRAIQTHRIPGSSDFHISTLSAHEGGGVVSRKKPATFTHQEIFLVIISVRVWVDPRAVVRLEGLSQ